MIEQFRQFIDQFIHLQESEFNAIVEVTSEMHFKKRDHLIRTTKTADMIGFFYNGYFRFYHYLENGTEVTCDFTFAPSFITSYTSLITGEPSNVYVQAMEDIKIIVIKKSDLQKLYSKYHNIDKLGRLMAEQVVITLERHLFCLLNHTAEERYKYLLDNYPQFIQKIPLQHIASYLGITKETISRIRRKISKSF